MLSGVGACTTVGVEVEVCIALQTFEPWLANGGARPEGKKEIVFRSVAH